MSLQHEWRSNRANNWELDGGDNMDNGSNTSLNVYPSLEAIAEFKVLTSNYGAQYGRNGSGTVEVETKSGTNAFHGSVFYFGRNDAFNARNFFDEAGVKAPTFKKHDFGYTIGGPIRRDKTYFSSKNGAGTSCPDRSSTLCHRTPSVVLTPRVRGFQ
jgi:hypothetical protein